MGADLACEPSRAGSRGSHSPTRRPRQDWRGGSALQGPSPDTSRSAYWPRRGRRTQRDDVLCGGQRGVTDVVTVMPGVPARRRSGCRGDLRHDAQDGPARHRGATHSGCLSSSTSRCMWRWETVPAISASSATQGFAVHRIHRSAPALTAAPRGSDHQCVSAGMYLSDDSDRQPPDPHAAQR